LKLRCWKTRFQDGISSAPVRESCSFCAVFNSTVSNRAFLVGWWRQLLQRCPGTHCRCRSKKLINMSHICRELVITLPEPYIENAAIQIAFTSVMIGYDGDLSAPQIQHIG